MSTTFTNSFESKSVPRGVVPLCAAAGAYLVFLFIGDCFLQDSDSFWQIKVGQWIIDQRALPYTDLYSFTRFGETWTSTSWLSQVLFAIAYGPFDWSGPVILTSVALAATVGIFIYLLEANLDPARSLLFAMVSLLVSIHHLLARPHILALPVLLAFIGGLIAAADRRTYPSWLLLPLIALWSNLHGGFVLGLALIGPIGLEAVWCADPQRRRALAVRWAIFGICALAASCFTPYGWNTLLGAARILNLGELLSVISEWQPAKFSSLGPFEASVLGLIGLGLFSGYVLSIPRIILLIGLTWMALTHVRNIEVFAFVVPLVLAKPLADQMRSAPEPRQLLFSCPPYVAALAALAVLVAASASTISYTARHSFLFSEKLAPTDAVEILKRRGVQRVFNAYEFGGYLIARDIRPFIDGRAELYGEKFVMDFFHACEARDMDDLLRMLDDYQIDATLLGANYPAARVLDHVAGWKRVYADSVAVIHVREDRPKTSQASTSQQPN
jgi:hypothetical protein